MDEDQVLKMVARIASGGSPVAEVGKLHHDLVAYVHEIIAGIEHAAAGQPDYNDASRTLRSSQVAAMAVVTWKRMNREHKAYWP